MYWGEDLIEREWRKEMMCADNMLSSERMDFSENSLKDICECEERISYFQRHAINHFVNLQPNELVGELTLCISSDNTNDDMHYLSNLLWGIGIEVEINCPDKADGPVSICCFDMAINIFLCKMNGQKIKQTNQIEIPLYILTRLEDLVEIYQKFPKGDITIKIKVPSHFDRQLSLKWNTYMLQEPDKEFQLYDREYWLTSVITATHNNKPRFIIGRDALRIFCWRDNLVSGEQLDVALKNLSRISLLACPPSNYTQISYQISDIRYYVIVNDIHDIKELKEVIREKTIHKKLDDTWVTINIDFPISENILMSHVMSNRIYFQFMCDHKSNNKKTVRL